MFSHLPTKPCLIALALGIPFNCYTDESYDTTYPLKNPKPHNTLDLRNQQNLTRSS